MGSASRIEFEILTFQFHHSKEGDEIGLGWPDKRVISRSWKIIQNIQAGKRILIKTYAEKFFSINTAPTSTICKYSQSQLDFTPDIAEAEYYEVGSMIEN